MSVRARLDELEALVDASGAAVSLEALLPVGGRPRQLPARTLLVGMLLVAADDRPAHLSRVRDALVSLSPEDRRRLHVTASWRDGAHECTYRQLEHMTRRLRAALSKGQSDGEPSQVLSHIVDDLIEASVPGIYKAVSFDLAVDWSDHETFARPGTGELQSPDPDAAWGHRRGNGPGRADELFFGYYLQFATMVGELGGEKVPELVRRMLLASARVDPPPAFAGVLGRLVDSGVPLGDVLCDCGYSNRLAANWALRVRSLGGRLVQDLHPADRGPKGTEGGAVIANGCLYCPATPPGLLGLGPVARGASLEQVAAHDKATEELSFYKLGRISKDDTDGYHRVCCPAVAGKVRCTLRPSSMSLSFERPEIAEVPSFPPRCCLQQTMTIAPTVTAKTAQRHDYPGKAWRLSYSRRSAAERTYSTTKDPARVNTARGWCRLSGLAGITPFLACAVVVRNLRIIDSFQTRLEADKRRAKGGLDSRQRSRRRIPIAELLPDGGRRPS